MVQFIIIATKDTFKLPANQEHCKYYRLNIVTIVIDVNISLLR